MIPYGKHYLDEDDIASVVEVLRDGLITQGPKIAEFENKIVEYTGAKYAVAVSSATAGLHLACIVSDVGQDDIVYTSANTFASSANCIVYVGGKPSFCDIDENTLNMCPNNLESQIKSNNGKIKAVIPVHFAGKPCDMKSFSSIGTRYKAKIIEDAAHALGATYECGRKVGSCFYSDMTVFSLHPVKGITSGEGGVITTNCRHTYKRLLILRSHGICKGNFDLPGISVKGENQLVNQSEAYDIEGNLNPWYYEMQELGFNYRITDFQCAMALSQMNKINTFIHRRNEIVDLYDKAFLGMDGIKTQYGINKRSSHHLYVIQIDFDFFKKDKAIFMRKLANVGIGTQVHYIPVPLHPYYQKIGHKIQDFPKTFAYYRSALSIPIYYGLKNSDVDFIVSNLKSILVN